jgi:superfamily I DNA/RNA helicase
LTSEEWQPVGVQSLESAALETVRSTWNRLVVAGPGAGKTELLAQRACYLLQTGTCQPRRQILAISFKRDAAANLQERVRRRCGDELARRFHSMTFDAFSKSLVDRFSLALPEEYRPTADYVISFEVEKRMRDHLNSVVGGETGLTRADVSGISSDRFYKRDFLGRALPIPTTDPRTIDTRAAEAVWRYLLKTGTRSQLDFGMIGRLAELLIGFNPLLRAAVRQTYSHLFLDEFQDTTWTQYALTRSLFRGSATVLTAVGDSKQRIMVWAGAVKNVFDLYRSDFEAEARNLVMNYRSAPNLVRIQQTLVAAIEPGTPTPESADDGSDGEGECRVLLYADHDREAKHLAEMAARWVQDDGVEPRDICVLTRNKPGDYVDTLVHELRTLGIKARVETDLQDLVVEALSRTLLAALAIGIRGQDREGWTDLISLLRDVRGLDEGHPRVRTAERELAVACRELGRCVTSPECDAEVVRDQFSAFLDFIGRDAFRRRHPQYLQGTFMDDVVASFSNHVWQCFEATGDWTEALGEIVGTNSIPIITVHKSKGLEYHTVVFMGLEDSALWSFANQSDEEKRTFFVAFSRAKKRVLFTFCDHRIKKGKGSGRQSRVNIGELYVLLESAGVETESIL